VKNVLRIRTGFINENCPLLRRAAPPERQQEEEENETKALKALMFPQKLAALAARIYAEDDNHGHKNNRLKQGFHIHLHRICTNDTAIGLMKT